MYKLALILLLFDREQIETKYKKCNCKQSKATSEHNTTKDLKKHLSKNIRHSNSLAVAGSAVRALLSCPPQSFSFSSSFVVCCFSVWGCCWAVTFFLNWCFVEIGWNPIPCTLLKLHLCLTLLLWIKFAKFKCFLSQVL